MRPNTLQELTVVREAGESLPSSLRLKTILMVFMVVMLMAVTGVTFSLVSGIFVRWGEAVREDLGWRATRSASELAERLDVGMAVSDRQLVGQSLSEYPGGADLLGVVVTNAAGQVLGRLGATPPDAAVSALFSAREGALVEAKDHLLAWRASRIENELVGRVAVLISTRRLAEGENLRRRILLLAGMACLGALAISLFFVNFYLGPVLRFAERTLDKLKNLAGTLEQRVEERTAALQRANARLTESLEKIRSMQRQLMDASRRAGMADVATTVLHNVGNVLNSVNVSANVVTDLVIRSRVVGLSKAADLLRAHAGDLAVYLTQDEKGKKLPAYLCSLAQAATDERAAMMKELASLQKNIDHVKVVVGRQQAEARAAVGVIERVQMAELLDDALGQPGGDLERRGIAVSRRYQDLPPVRLDRHKLLQILGNLIGNARDALQVEGAGEGTVEKRITLHLRAAAEGRFAIDIEDTGVGIPAENLHRVFTYGFTTKRDGHGFGLHASACAAAEMGGTLTVHSEGPGRGARFTIELPCDPPAGYSSLTNSGTDISVVRRSPEGF